MARHMLDRSAVAKTQINEIARIARRRGMRKRVLKNVRHLAVSLSGFTIIVVAGTRLLLQSVTIASSPGGELIFEWSIFTLVYLLLVGVLMWGWIDYCIQKFVTW